MPTDEFTAFKQRKCGGSAMGHQWAYEPETKMKQCVECQLALVWLPEDTEPPRRQAP